MRGPSLDLKSRISAKISGARPDSVWTQADFADLGPRHAVDKALQRLVATGGLRRIDRGLYDRPRTNPLTKKPTVADYRAVIEAVARRDKARILIDGMTAANDLGLSDAVSGRVAVHTDARLKPLNLGNITISFRPTTVSKLYWAGRPAMRIVQALYWLSPKLVDPDQRQRARRRITALLADSKQGPALRRDLVDGLPTLPTWMQDFLRDLIAPKRVASNPAVRAPAARRRKASAA